MAINEKMYLHIAVSGVLVFPVDVDSLFSRCDLFGASKARGCSESGIINPRLLLFDP